MRFIVMPVMALALGAVLAVPPAQAKGCLKGAVVGGAAGHMVNHGVAGAAAGCAIGHHEANKQSNQNAAQTQPSNGSGQQGNNAASH
jgi:hypothetical protein